MLKTEVGGERIMSKVGKREAWEGDALELVWVYYNFFKKKQKKKTKSNHNKLWLYRKQADSG